MEIIIRYIVLGIYIVICVAIIILALLQAKDSAGASGAIVGGESGSGNFYEKNKGRTKEGKMKRWTIILGIMFALLSIGLGIAYEFAK